MAGVNIAAIIDYIGPLLDMIDPADKRPAREQFDAKYHFGGWQPIPGFTLNKDLSLKYPRDPALKSLAAVKLHDEMVVFYDHAIVAIVQPDGSFEVARMD